MIFQLNLEREVEEEDKKKKSTDNTMSKATIILGSQWGDEGKGKKGFLKV